MPTKFKTLAAKRAASIRALSAAADVLCNCPNHPRARCRLYELVKPLAAELRDTPLPRRRALDWFEAHASEMLELVSDAQVRDAYLLLLWNRYFPEAYTFMFGAPPPIHAWRYDGIAAEPASPEYRQLAAELENKLEFWTTEAYRRTIDQSANAEPAPESKSKKRSDPCLDEAEIDKASDAITRSAANMTSSVVGGMPVPSVIVRREEGRVEREAAIDAFRDRCLAAHNVRVCRQDVRRVAGYKSNIALYQWLKQGGMNKRFRQTMTMPTSEFVEKAVRLRPTKKSRSA